MEHTILVAEDDQGIREAIGIYMENQGYHVVLAENGQEGLEFMKQYPIHLAIVDIMMPITVSYTHLTLPTNTEE